MKRRAANPQQHRERRDEREREERDVQAKRPAVKEEIPENAERDRRSEKSETEPPVPTHT
jgi:hypothetical protein